MIRVSEIYTTGKDFPSRNELDRLQKVTDNRSLYNNDFTALGVVRSDVAETLTRFNWFRRIPSFYAEFLYGKEPIITIEGNQRMTDWIANLSPRLFKSLEYAMIDMLRYGTAAIATNPLNPLELQIYQPDSWFPVINDDGTLWGDLIAFRRQGLREFESGSRAVSHPTKETDLGNVEVIKYPISGPATRDIYQLTGSTIGALQSSVVLPQRLGRQVVNLYNGYAVNMEGVSIFEDVRDSIGELSRQAESLSHTIKRNLRPHLYAPDSILKGDENGRFELNSDGMMFPIAEGDITPGYLQWDSNVEALKVDNEIHEQNIFDMTGLTRSLFRSEGGMGVTTGAALKRLMLPFYAKLNSLTASNTIVIIAILRMLNANNSVNGEEVFEFEDSDVTIAWHHDEIFSDETIDDNSSESEDDTDSTI